MPALRRCGKRSPSTGADVGVVITDTAGRPWRLGVTDFCIGAAGVTVIEDLRGTTDDLGQPLEMTQVAVADEIAAAADLVKGKTGGTPVAVVRGVQAGGDSMARDLVRPSDEDLFSSVPISHANPRSPAAGPSARSPTARSQ